MPLRRGKKNFKNNVEEMINAGHPQKQALAAAYRMLRKAGKKRAKQKKKQRNG